MARARVRVVVGIYAVLGTVAWAATSATGRSPWHAAYTLAGRRWVSLPVAVVLGVVTGVAGVVLTRWIAVQTRWGRSLRGELALGLSGLTASAATPLAIASALGEELLFRGAVQRGLVLALGILPGLALASTVFGCMHVPWNRRLLSWTVTAAVMGLVFGALDLVTGELLAPVLAHAIINRENLRFILAEARAPGRTLRVRWPERSLVRVRRVSSGS
jgi:membrane protease YdiL (CAAX protease family)